MNAWLRLGRELDNPPNAEAALKEALLAHWDVRKVPLYAALPEDANGVSRTVEVRERVAVVRDSPTGEVEHIGIVSPSYPILQNEEQAPFLDALAEESGASFYAAGDFDAGRSVFVTLRLPGHLSVGHDQVVCLLSTVKSHDGCRPFSLLATPVLGEVVLASHKILDVRHTTGTADILHQQARSALDAAFNYLEGFHHAARQLVKIPMDFAAFESAVDAAYGPRDGDSTAKNTRATRRVEEMTGMFGDGTTAWDGFVVLAGWFDHHSPTRGRDRAVNALLEPGFKDAALLLMARG